MCSLHVKLSTEIFPSSAIYVFMRHYMKTPSTDGNLNIMNIKDILDKIIFGYLCEGTNLGAQPGYAYQFFA